MAEWISDDDDWDVPDDQLQVLEHNAILSTQQQSNAEGLRDGSKPAVSRNSTLRQSSTQRLSNSSDLRRVAAANQPQNGRVSAEDSFDNPTLDEDGIPLVVEQQRQSYKPQGLLDENTQREQWRAGRYADKHGPEPQLPPPRAQGKKASDGQAFREYMQTNPNSPHVQAILQRQKREQQQKEEREQQQAAWKVQAPSNDPETESLQSMLEELRKERDLLDQNLKSATTQLNTARGEISVIRSKSAVNAKTAERQMSILKKQMQEEVTKHTAAIQSKEAAFRELNTEKSFLQQDLKDTARKVETLQRQAKDRPLQGRPSDVNISPRKGLGNHLRDGFGDGDIMQISPTLSPAKRRGSKPSTPTKKRKQPTTNQTDALPLRLTQIEGLQAVSREPSRADSDLHNVKDIRPELHLRFVQDVLAFRPTRSQDNLIEVLVKYAFPSETTRPLSSILMDEIQKLKGERLPAILTAIFLEWLDRCTKEQYYSPVSIILAAIDHILTIEPLILDIELVKMAVPPIQALASINARVRWILDNNKGTVWDDKNPKPEFEHEVDTDVCLDILCTIASLIVDEPDLISLFWRYANTESVLILLSPRLPVTQLIHMLELLETSVLPTTFGIICDTQAIQLRTEEYLVDKIAFLLWDPPQPIIKTHQDKLRERAKPSRRRQYQNRYQNSKLNEPPPSRPEICNLRLTAINLLTKFIMTSIPHPHTKNIESHHGLNFILTHPNSIARLVRLLYDEINNLYAVRPFTHDLHVRLVNRTTILLHHILLSPQATAPDSALNLPKAMTGTLGGINKFRVVMTRVGLGDTVSKDIEPGIKPEVGIYEETAEMARQILSEYVTPEEARQFEEAFGIMSIEEHGDMDDEEAEAEVMAGVDAA